nr:hypothetical protein [uncultured Nitrososphaera sp.]
MGITENNNAKNVSPYKCLECKAKFATRDEFRKHVKKTAHRAFTVSSSEVARLGTLSAREIGGFDD